MKCDVIMKYETNTFILNELLLLPFRQYWEIAALIFQQAG